jgi:hypothetical protein
MTLNANLSKLFRRHTGNGFRYGIGSKYSITVRLSNQMPVQARYARVQEKGKTVDIELAFKNGGLASIL